MSATSNKKYGGSSLKDSDKPHVYELFSPIVTPFRFIGNCVSSIFVSLASVPSFSLKHILAFVRWAMFERHGIRKMKQEEVKRMKMMKYDNKTFQHAGSFAEDLDLGAFTTVSR